MRRLLIPFAVLAACPAPADAYEIAGRPWPAADITYHTSAPRYRAAVDRAARAWNREELGVRFVRAPADQADVIVRYGGRACDGLARVRVGRWAAADVTLGRGCDTRLVTLTAVHELGHVLGLGHEPGRCARMNPGFDQTGTPDGCRPRTLSEWLARPLLDDDRAGARALYG